MGKMYISAAKKPTYRRKKRNYSSNRVLKQLMPPEPKNHILAEAAQTFNYTGIVRSLTSIGQGDGPTQRDGNRIMPRYLSMNFSIPLDTTLNTQTVVKFIIFRSWIEQSNISGTLAPNEVLDITGTSGAPYSHLLSTITGSRGDRGRRIQVLYSRLYSLNNVNRSSIVGKLNLRMNGGKKKEFIQFVNNAANEPSDGGLYFLLVSDSVTTATSISYSAKTTYYDL